MRKIIKLLDRFVCFDEWLDELLATKVYEPARVCKFVNFSNLCLVFYTKLVDGFLCVDLSGFEYYRREVSAVGAIGEVLCLKAECRVLAECCAMLSLITISPII